MPKKSCVIMVAMKIDNKNARQTLETAKAMLAKEKNISPAFLAVLNLLLMFMRVMLDRFGLNGKNSNKAPASDPNRAKKSNKMMILSQGK